MSPSGKTIRKLILSLFLAGCWLLSACSSGAPAYTSPTKTAQAARAIALATQMAGRLEGTYSVIEAQFKATAQTRQTQLETATRWPRVFLDPFDEPAHDWHLGQKEGPLATIEWRLVDGKYRWEAKANDGFVWWVYPQMKTVTDFYLSVSADNMEGPASAGHGVIFHHTDDNDYYLFELSQDDEFALFIFNQGEWETLLDWSPSSAIAPNEPNQIAIVANGSQYNFYINQEWAAEYFDDRLRRGTVGLLVGLSNADDEGVWEFDDFDLHAPFEIIPEVQSEFSAQP